MSEGIFHSTTSSNHKSSQITHTVVFKKKKKDQNTGVTVKLYLFVLFLVCFKGYGITASAENHLLPFLKDKLLYSMHSFITLNSRIVNIKTQSHYRRWNFYVLIQVLKDDSLT